MQLLQKLREAASMISSGFSTSGRTINEFAKSASYAVPGCGRSVVVTE
jgi:hypothetical protein